MEFKKPPLIGPLAVEHHLQKAQESENRADYSEQESRVLSGFNSNTYNQRILKKSKSNIAHGAKSIQKENKFGKKRPDCKTRLTKQLNDLNEIRNDLKQLA